MERAAPPHAAPRPQGATPARPVVKPTTSFARVLERLGLGTPAPPKALPPLHAPPQGAPHVPAHAVVTPRHQERGDGQRESSPKDDPHEATREVESGDPTWAHRSALMAPPPGDLLTDARQHVGEVARHASALELAPQLLRKMAWSGDGKRGAARLELGSGALSGAVVTLEADGHEVALSVEGLTAAEETSLRGRLAEGLSARGFRLVG